MQLAGATPIWVKKNLNYLSVLACPEGLKKIQQVQNLPGAMPMSSLKI